MDGVFTAKDEFRRLLHRRAKALGLNLRATEILVARAEILPVRRAGSRICGHDDCADYVRFLVQGAAKLVCRAPDERRVTIRFLGPGHFLCLVVPDPRLAYRAEVVAHSDATVALLTRAHLLEAIAALPLSGMGQLASWSFRHATRLLQEKVLLFPLPIHERLKHELRSLVRLFGYETEGGWALDPPVSHQDLADLVIASRARVSNAFGTLAREGFVRSRGKQFLVCRSLMADRGPSRRCAAGRGIEHRA
jgi:CRP-like cAMP-binding protein